jgi:Transposase DDE domain
MFIFFQEALMYFSTAQALRQIHNDLPQQLDSDTIHEICHASGYTWRERLLGPVATLHLFVLQILHGNTAITHLRHLARLPFTATAYCLARARLPLDIFQRLLQRITQALQPALQQQDGRWRGHRVFHVDGSSFSMPDTPALQATFGQPGVQKPGCGFPVAHLLVLFHASTGLLLKALAAPLRTHDMAQVAELHPELQAGDVVVADRGLCSFAHLALLQQRLVHGLFRVHQRQLVDFTPQRPYNAPGKKPIKGLPTSRWLRSLGVTDQVVEWFKPKERPEWLTQEQYAALPASLELREVRYRVTQPGFRTRAVTVVTTLLDPEAYPAEALAQLYRQRWQVETNIKHLKTTMAMDVLRCETEQGVLKELAMFALVYNLVRVVMWTAAQRQGVAAERISFVDALRWLTDGDPHSPLPELVVNPYRPDRVEPRATKRRPKEYDRLNRPRAELRKRLLDKQVAA